MFCFEICVFLKKAGNFSNSPRIIDRACRSELCSYKKDIDWSEMLSIEEIPKLGSSYLGHLYVTHGVNKEIWWRPGDEHERSDGQTDGERVRGTCLASRETLLVSTTPLNDARQVQRLPAVNDRSAVNSSTVAPRSARETSCAVVARLGGCFAGGLDALRKSRARMVTRKVSTQRQCPILIAVVREPHDDAWRNCFEL